MSDSHELGSGPKISNAAVEKLEELLSKEHVRRKVADLFVQGKTLREVAVKLAIEDGAGEIGRALRHHFTTHDKAVSFVKEYRPHSTPIELSRINVRDYKRR